MQTLVKTLVLSSLLVMSAASFADDEVSLVTDGIWGNETQITGNGFGYKEWNFWLDVRVANLAYNKVVGIVWTDNDWASSQNTYLSYESTYPDGYEQWGADVTPIGQFEYTRYAPASWTNSATGSNTPNAGVVTIEYAIFYEVNGAVYWDNNFGENYQMTIDPISYNN